MIASGLDSLLNLRKAANAVTSSGPIHPHTRSVGIGVISRSRSTAILAAAFAARSPPASAGTGTTSKAVSAGLTARQMLESPLKAYVLLGGIDPANDFGVDAGALAGADLVVAVTTHLPEALRNVVHVVLPIGSFAEPSGTYVSTEGRWQSWAGAAKLPGESRPGWKVLFGVKLL